MTVKSILPESVLGIVAEYLDSEKDIVKPFHPDLQTNIQLLTVAARTGDTALVKSVLRKSWWQTRKTVRNKYWTILQECNSVQVLKLLLPKLSNSGLDLLCLNADSRRYTAAFGYFISKMTVVAKRHLVYAITQDNVKLLVKYFSQFSDMFGRIDVMDLVEAVARYSSKSCYAYLCQKFKNDRLMASSVSLRMYISTQRHDFEIVWLLDTMVQRYFARWAWENPLYTLKRGNPELYEHLCKKGMRSAEDSDEEKPDLVLVCKN